MLGGRHLGGDLSGRGTIARTVWVRKRVGGLFIITPPPSVLGARFLLLLQLTIFVCHRIHQPSFIQLAKMVRDGRMTAQRLLRELHVFRHTPPTLFIGHRLVASSCKNMTVQRLVVDDGAAKDRGSS